MKESRREKFVRLAERRTTKAIKDIRLIGNLSNAKLYGYEKKDLDKIFRVLDRELKSAKSRFESGSDSDATVFKL